MLLKTDRLQIRHIVQEDWKSVKDIWDDFRMSEYAKYDIPHKSDEADVRAQILLWEKANSGTKHMFFAVCLETKIIGYIDFHHTGDGYDCGYCFHSDYYGKGYAKESFQALLNYLTTLGIKRFTVGTAIENLPSVRLLISLGFQQIGLEQISFYKDSEGKDIVFDGGIFELKISEDCNSFSCNTTEDFPGVGNL